MVAEISSADACLALPCTGAQESAGHPHEGPLAQGRRCLTVQRRLEPDKMASQAPLASESSELLAARKTNQPNPGLKDEHGSCISMQSSRSACRDTTDKARLQYAQIGLEDACTPRTHQRLLQFVKRLAVARQAMRLCANGNYLTSMPP